jgi:hypothetical protein
MPFPTSSDAFETTLGFYTPDVVEIVEPLTSRQTDSGYISPFQTGKENYVATGVSFPSYSYLATGRFLSTQVTPTEYGDRDALDSLLVLIYVIGKTQAEKDTIRPTQVVRLYRKQYTPETGKLYRLVTGNPYPTHFEYRLVPIPD